MNYQNKCSFSKSAHFKTIHTCLFTPLTKFPETDKDREKMPFVKYELRWIKEVFCNFRDIFIEHRSLLYIIFQTWYISFYLRSCD